MNLNQKSYSFLFGWFAITANALHRLNLLDAYCAIFRHACADAVEFCLLDQPGKEPTPMMCCRQATTHMDRHGTAFWIITEADLSKTTIMLVSEV